LEYCTAHGCSAPENKFIAMLYLFGASGSVVG
jgi:hypothetical protein